jgi:hypothetical protein
VAQVFNQCRSSETTLAPEIAENAENNQKQLIRRFPSAAFGRNQTKPD